MPPLITSAPVLGFAVGSLVPDLPSFGWCSGYTGLNRPLGGPSSPQPAGQAPRNCCREEPIAHSSCSCPLLGCRRIVGIDFTASHAKVPANLGSDVDQPGVAKQRR